MQEKIWKKSESEKKKRVKSSEEEEEFVFVTELLIARHDNPFE